MSLASLAVFASLNGSAYPCTLRATQFPALVLRAISLTILVIAFRWICATGRPGSCASGGGVALFQSNPDTRTRKFASKRHIVPSPKIMTAPAHPGKVAIYGKHVWGALLVFRLNRRR